MPDNGVVVPFVQIVLSVPRHL